MRLDKHHYFLIVAQAAALRSTCPRKQVGAVLVSCGEIVATGRNGSAPGEAHCEDVGCLIWEDGTEGGGCIRTLHAEQNALGRGQRGDTLYCTDQPCLPCFKLALTNGCEEIYYLRRNDRPDRDLFVAENKLEDIMQQVIDCPKLCLSVVIDARDYLPTVEPRSAQMGGRW